MLRTLFNALKPGGEIIIDCQAIPQVMIDGMAQPMALLPRYGARRLTAPWITCCRRSHFLSDMYATFQQEIVRGG
jgi:hypothetical protein